MKRAHIIVATAVVLYAVVMAVAWIAETRRVHERADLTLREARASFVRMSEDAIDSVLWYSTRLIFDEIDETAKPLPVATMCELAQKNHLDEINIVGAEGRVIASNFASQIGDDFHRHPLLREFLNLLEPDRARAAFGQPYRPSLCDATSSYKYYGAAFPDRSGILQIGFTREHILQTFARTPVQNYKQLTIGHYGHFEAIDRNGDGFPDRASNLPGGMPTEGIMGAREDPELGRVLTYDFDYFGLLFRAVVFESNFYQSRNRLVFFGGGVLAVLLTFFTILFLRLSASSERVAVLHRAAEARTAADMAVARLIQTSSLPRTALFRPAHLDSAFNAATFPARDVGGDFYCLFELSDGRVVFLVGDVSGKGVPAALFMHIALNAIRMGFHAVDGIAEAVAAVNDYLCENNEAEMFVTVWFGILNPATGEVEYVNAGHNRPYVMRRDGRVERLEGRGGRFLGMFPQLSYRSDRFVLEPGDRLFLFTDGVTEAMDGARHPFGEKRLVEVLSAAPADACQAVKAAVDAYVKGAERSDDLTMMELTWYGRPPRVEGVYPSTDEGLAQATGFLRAHAGLSDRKQLSRLINATDEMLSNVVNYSGVPEFRLAVEKIPGRCRVTISDEGSEYNPLTHVDPDTHLPLQSRAIGGLGILIAKKLVNSVAYRREDARNVLRLVQFDFDATAR